MGTTEIKEKLHQYIEIAEDKKLQAIYALIEDDIELDEDYPDEFKAELDERLSAYQTDGITINEQQANQRINDLFQKLKTE